MRRLLTFGLIALAACGGGSNAFPIIASSPGTVGLGSQRVLVGIIDLETNRLLVDGEVEALATLRNENGSPLSTAEGELVWTVPDVRGLLAFNVDIPEPATYQLTIETDRWGELGPVGLVATENTVVVSPGEPAPRSETRTSATHDIVDISSDPTPQPSFYEMSLDQAIADGPTVAVFATPAWCTSAACGPLLDQVGDLSADYPDLNFVHIEIYEDIHVDSSDDLEVVEAVVEWGLPSEPWVFVIDAEGMVTASFEGAASDAELREAFDQVSG